MTPSLLWQPWRGRHWPALPSEEVAFAADLRTIAQGSTASFDRGEVSAVLNALRCGIDADAMVQRLPGCDPAALLAAYEHVEEARSRSVDAWSRIVLDPSVNSFSENASEATLLFSPIVYRLTRAVRHGAGASLVSALVSVVGEMEANRQEELAIEARLGRLDHPSARAVELGRRLYDPYEPGVWGRHAYIPLRVGALTPLRVRDLLGESPR